MPNCTELTAVDHLLSAAAELEKTGQSPFSAEALIVAAWQQNPRTFGLKGYAEQYPDSNKVVASLCGERGMVRRGLLNKVGQKLYALTAEGKRRIRGDESPPYDGQPVSLDAADDATLRRLLATTAWSKWDHVEKQSLTFADACRFWNVRENMAGPALDARIEQTTQPLQRIRKALDGRRAVLSDGREVGGEHAELLHDLNHYLLERFARHLSLLHNRIGR